MAGLLRFGRLFRQRSALVALQIVAGVLSLYVFGGCCVMSRVGDCGSDAGWTAVVSAGADDAELHCSLGDLTWTFTPGTCVLRAFRGREEVLALHRPGPVRDASERDGALMCTLPSAGFSVDRSTVRYGCGEEAAGWSVALSAESADGIVLEFTSGSGDFARAVSGLLHSAGEWTALDLNHYQLAHGQTHWPKTYYLSSRARGESAPCSRASAHPGGRGSLVGSIAGAVFSQ